MWPDVLVSYGMAIALDIQAAETKGGAPAGISFSCIQSIDPNIQGALVR
jgi:hypothetical protein